MVIGGAVYGLTSRPTEVAQAAPTVLTYNIGTARPNPAHVRAFVTSPPNVPQGFGTPTWSADRSLEYPVSRHLRNDRWVGVETDEDWTREGIVAGASVGVDHVDVYFTKITVDGPLPITCAQMDAIGNVWIQVEGTT
jgi:hypothetical protein